mmetsp:Transcript_4955/g.14302  ORF Transcript_4955/g.14302 Transcript_4955/m.14302 type:complete len:259 (+) Transcript_4955:134-910(+)
MGRSKRLQAWQKKTKAERLNEDDEGQRRASWHGLGVKQSRRTAARTAAGIARAPAVSASHPVRRGRVGLRASSISASNRLARIGVALVARAVVAGNAHAGRRVVLGAVAITARDRALRSLGSSLRAIAVSARDIAGVTRDAVHMAVAISASRASGYDRARHVAVPVRTGKRSGLHPGRLGAAAVGARNLARRGGRGLIALAAGALDHGLVVAVRLITTLCRAWFAIPRRASTIAAVVRAEIGVLRLAISLRRDGYLPV